MTVYVDQVVDYGEAATAKGLPATEWAHLTADTRSELHNFARTLRLARSWFQDDPVIWHYDVTVGKRHQAIRLGARVIDVYEMGDLISRRRAEVRGDAPAPAAVRTGPDVGEPAPIDAGMPIGVNGAWLSALTRAAGQCECAAHVRGHSHRGTDGRCPVRQAGTGSVGRLYLLIDGALTCEPCAKWREHTGKTTTVVSIKGRIAELGPSLENDPRIVYLGRRITMGGWNLAAHPLANPFSVADAGTADQAVSLYRAHLADRPDLRALIPALRGRTLACWCPPGEPCHVRVVAEIADGHASAVVADQGSLF
jgi:Protein of unknown function (DUF4031)/Domain of unknown function (DUF4326)